VTVEPGPTLRTAEPRLQLDHVAKQFAGVHALRDASLEVNAGEVHGLLGENGSGKSTLIKILAGYHVPDAGNVYVDGRAQAVPPTAGQLAQLGVAFVHQDLGLIDSLSVTENLLMRELSVRRGAFISWRTEHARAEATLASYGISARGADRVSTLPPFQRAMIAIIRAVEGISSTTGTARGLLVLDEAMAFLADDERAHLAGIMRRLAASGVSVLLVTHDLDDALAFCDRITVLRDGRVAGVVGARSTTPAQLAALILGNTALRAAISHRPAPDRASLLLATGQAPGFAPFTLTVGAGEIVGITGLAGESFGRLPYLLYGAVKGARGTLYLDEVSHPLERLTPADCVAAGIVLVPGDRQRQGAVGSLTVQENMLIPRMSEFRTGMFVRRRPMFAEAARMIGEYDVRPPAAGAVMSTLSGGNQQKAIVAKWLALSPKVLLLDEPTIGVDIGSREQIFDYVKTLAAGGTGVLCSSVDYAQLAALCDRVLIFARGAVIAEISGAAITKDEILSRCLLQAQGQS